MALCEGTGEISPVSLYFEQPPVVVLVCSCLCSFCSSCSSCLCQAVPAHSLRDIKAAASSYGVSQSESNRQLDCKTLFAPDVKINPSVFLLHEIDISRVWILDGAPFQRVECSDSQPSTAMGVEGEPPTLQEVQDSQVIQKMV